MKDWLLTSLLLLGLILSGCGGSGGESETTLTQEDTQLIKSTLDDLGFGDLSILTNDQISQITSELKGQGFSDNDIEALFKELNINQTDREEVGDQNNNQNNNQNNDQNNDQANLLNFDSSAINFWQGSGGQYLHIGDHTISVYQLINNTTDNTEDTEENFENYCYVVDIYTLNGEENGSVNLINPITNVHYEQLFILEDDLLNFTPPNGVNSEFHIVQGIGSSKSCNNNKTVTIDLTLRALPSQIKENKGTYRWDIGFDLNKTGIIDTGDIRVSITHRADSSSTEIINLSTLTSRLWYTNERPDGALGHRSSSTLTVDYTISGSTLELTFTDKINALAQLINTDTPVFINTYLEYPDPEREVFGNNQSSLDGPWLWSESSNIHTDRFPEEGYINAGNGITHQDVLYDQVGEAGWIDIDNVSITITPIALP